MLITGGRGLIGAILTRELADEHEIVEIDTRRAGILRSRSGDMRDLDAVQQTFDGCDAVIDLAADSRADAGWSSVYGTNVLAAYNCFEASRQAGVKRVVFASSNHVTGLYEREHPYSAIVAGRYGDVDRDTIPYIGPEHPIRPDGLYGVGKAFGEAVGRLYAEEHGLSVVCLRIGTVNSADRPTSARHFSTLLTHADLVRLVRAALAAPSDTQYAIVYGVSANTWRFWDLESARTSIGFAPRDDAERFR